MSCQCELCQYTRKFDEHAKSITSPEARQFFEDMFERLNCAESDAEIKQAVIDGSWPNADEVIAAARGKHDPRNDKTDDKK